MKNSIAAAVMVLTVAACGSTVRTSEVVGRTGQGLADAGPGGAAGGGPNASSLAATGSSGGGSGSGGVGTGAGNVPSSGGSGIAAGPAGADGSPGAVVAPQASPSVGASGNGPIPIGIVYPKNNAAAHTAVGAGSSNPAGGDQELNEWKALVDNLNKHGGILGHPIAPVYSPDDAAGGDLSTQEQSMCAAFTQDNHVVAVMLSGIYTQTILTCLAKAGVLAWAPPTFLFDDQSVFDSFPFYATAGSLNLSRLPGVYVGALHDEGYFTKGAKIGLVSYNTPSYERGVQQAFKPALAQYGLSLTDVVYVQPLTTAGAVGNAAPSIQNAVLKFESEGITHVLFYTSSGLGFVWMTAAESQRYRPRYGLSSQDTPQGLALTVPAAQLAGSVGVGWLQAYDVANPPHDAQAQHCDAVMASYGEPTGGEAWTFCDQLWTFGLAATKAGGAGPAAVVGALPALGAVPSANALGVAYPNGERDGADVAAHLAFFADCKCFHYTAPPYHLAGG